VKSSKADGSRKARVGSSPIVSAIFCYIFKENLHKKICWCKIIERFFMNGSIKASLNKKNNFWIKFLICSIAVLLIAGIFNFFSGPIKSGFYTISYPAQSVFWGAGESCASFFDSVFGAGSISQKNKKLEEENQKLLSQVISLKSILNGNEAQSAISLACQNAGFDMVMAGVTGLDDQDIITINKGSDSGIAKGMPVINEQSVLFGKVLKVYKNFSQVMLISNSDSVIDVTVMPSFFSGSNDSGWQTDNLLGINGVVKGSGNLSSYLDLVPVDDNLNVGDKIITSSLEGTFPKGLLVGEISKVEKNDQSPHQKAQVNLLFNLSTDNLFVILNYKR